MAGLSTVLEGRRRRVPPSPVGRRFERGRPYSRPARASTLETREKQLRVAASALVHQGVERESIVTISDLVTLEHFKLILRFLLDRHDGQTSPQVAQIAAFLKGVARHWAKADDLTLLQMQKLASRLSTGRRGLTAKNRERLRPFDDPQTVALFLGLPQRIRREVEKDPRAPERKAVIAQMAAAIAILLVVPLRIGNLAKIDMRKNLIARGKRVYLVVPEGDTKNGEPVDFELPPEIVEIVGWYVREYRPHLLRAPTNSLFPGEGSRAKSAAGLGAQIKAGKLSIHRPHDQSSPFPPRRREDLPRPAAGPVRGRPTGSPPSFDRDYDEFLRRAPKPARPDSTTHR